MGKRLFWEKVIMDAMQKGIIKATVDAKRYFFIEMCQEKSHALAW